MPYKDPEVAKAKRKEYKEKNKEIIKEKDSLYIEKNREAIKERKKLRYIKDKEKREAKKLDETDEEKEARLKKQRDYHTLNKERNNANLRKSRAKKRALKGNVPKKQQSQESRQKQAASLRAYYAKKELRFRKVCEFCKKDFYVRKSSKAKFCNKTCYAGHLKENPLRYWLGKKLTFTPGHLYKKGNVPLNYIDGRSKEKDLIGRRCVEVAKWRKNVYFRDDHTCQKCCVRGGKLHAHHILNFKTNEDLRTDLDNGITLCEKDHKEFHKIYSKKNNTREQLIEFLVLKEITDAHT